MSKKKKVLKDLPFAEPEGLGGEQGLPTTPVPAKPEVKKVRPVPPQMVTFDRYFISLGRPMHHKEGMAAYKNIKGKKTVEVWKSLFAEY